MVSEVGQDASDAIDHKRSWRLRYQQRKKHHGMASPPLLTLKSVVGSEEGWQVVRPHQRRLHRRRHQNHTPPFTSPLWRACASTVRLPHTGGRIAISPPVTSTAMDFSVTYEIVSILGNLMLFMLWVTLRHVLMLMVGVSSRLGMMVQVLTLPRRQHITPSRLMELETLLML
jgi:hypothetical protein